MPGRTQSSAADGDWSDASEDAVKSGSATDASKTEGDDPGGQNFGGLGVKSSLMFLSSRGVGVKDPVHSVLDKIDAELAAMSSSHSKGGRGSARQSTTCKPKSSLPPLLTSYNTLYTTDSADKSGRTNALGVKGGAALEKDQHHITGSAEIYTDATLTDDEARATHSAEDFLGDLDSVVAQQIDSRFKEIMLKKKGTTTPPPSSHPASVLTLSPPTPFSAYLDNNSSPLNFPSETSPPPKPLTTAGYGTDNDSIKTEDFESRFENLIITDGNTSGESAKTSRHKRAKNSNGNGGLRKAGLGSGFGSGASMSVSAARPSTKPAAMNVAGWTSARGGSGGVGKVTFDVSSTEKDGKAASPSSLRMNGLNRVLQHSMKSLGETNAKEPAESASTALASLPPSGRSRSVSPERLINNIINNSNNIINNSNNIINNSNNIINNSNNIINNSNNIINNSNNIINNSNNIINNSNNIINNSNNNKSNTTNNNNNTTTNNNNNIIINNSNNIINNSNNIINNSNNIINNSNNIINNSNNIINNSNNIINNSNNIINNSNNIINNSNNIINNSNNIINNSNNIINNSNNNNTTTNNNNNIINNSNNIINNNNNTTTNNNNNIINNSNNIINNSNNIINNSNNIINNSNNIINNSNNIINNSNNIINNSNNIINNSNNNKSNTTNNNNNTTTNNNNNIINNVFLSYLTTGVVRA
ncbi:hypothetical protein ACOMHN_016911 [Nucella lapillus]